MNHRQGLSVLLASNLLGNLGRAGKRVILLAGLTASIVVPALFNGGPVMADPELVVGCPGGFSTIQAAVNAASPGGKIRVCAGTYNEQVTINKRLTITGDNGAVVKPSAMIANTTNLFSGAPVAAVMLVRDTDRVTIQELTVDGSNNGIGSCSPFLVGIFYRNASGDIDDCAVRNFRLGSGLEGCQSGLGIFVQSGGGGTSKVKVSDTSVHDYQKNGITGNEVGTDIEVDDNVVTGIGPTTGAAQNGVQVGFGATGAVRENSIINHIWSPCVSPSICSDIATNVLIFDANDVVVMQNTLGKSQTSVSIVDGNNCKVQGNTVFDTDVFDGVALQGDNNMVTNNHITNSDEAAVFVNGDHNKVNGNKINEAPVGILKAAGSVGNLISGNSFVNTTTQVVDPPPPLGIGPRPFR